MIATSASRKKLEDAKDLDRSIILDRAVVVTAAVIGCSKDNERGLQLVVPSAELNTHTLCKWVEVDTMDTDMISNIIQECDVAIILLSDKFAVAPMAFQTMIFVLRSIRKPSRFFNLMPTYMALVGNAQYRQSSISLLVGNGLIYNNWEALLTDWVAKFKHTATNTSNSDEGPLHPAGNMCYLSCYTEANELAVTEITSAMTGYQFTTLESVNDVPPFDASAPCCVLVFVSYQFAQDSTKRAILDAVIAKHLPMVVVVVTDRSNKSWMQTGLGIVLSNELWVDFAVAPFYKPGEIVPSFQKRIRELSIRLRNACLMPAHDPTHGIVTENTVDPTSAGQETTPTDQHNPNTTLPSTQASPALTTAPARIFISSSWVDSDITEHDFGPGGFAHFLTHPWGKEHAPLRYASTLYAKSDDFHIDADVNIRQETRDFFHLTAERLFLADVVILFWSPQYVKSFFCYNETFQSIVWQHKCVVIVFLEGVESILTALQTMPQHEVLLPHLHALRGCEDRGAPVTAGRLTGVSVVNKSYEQVCEELCAVLKQPTAQTLPARTDINSAENGCEVLISYCWSNSASAYHAGHVSSAEGRTDPRILKGHLESATGRRCWLDIERLGTGTGGLFQGIHAALSSPTLKCVILCVSDEYVRSPNCMMELEYAIRRIPVLVVSVGCGYAWRVKLAGYFLAYQETFDMVLNPFPQSEKGVDVFDKLAERVSALCSAGAHVTTTALR